MEPKQTQDFSTRRINLIIFLLLCLYPLVGMGIDLIAPSLPAISHTLKVSNSISKNLIAIYLFGYALGNLLIGFLSDTLGRRKLMMASFLVFSIASLLPILFPDPLTLLISRFFQGFSLAGFGVIGRAVIADLLSAEKLKQVAVLSATMWGIGPVIGRLLAVTCNFILGGRRVSIFFASMVYLV